MKIQFSSSLLITTVLSISVSGSPAAAQQFDLSEMDTIQTKGPQSYSSGNRGDSGNRTRSTRPGAIANRSIHDYRNTTKTQSPGGYQNTALNQTRWAVLGGIFGYEDGGMGANRDGSWTMPYTPMQAPPIYSNGTPGSGDAPTGQSDGQGADQPQYLHDGTPYNGQMTISDCGGYIGYVPADFQGSMDDWWHSPYSAYQVTPERPTNIHYQSWISQGSPNLF